MIIIISSLVYFVILVLLLLFCRDKISGRKINWTVFLLVALWPLVATIFIILAVFTLVLYPILDDIKSCVRERF